MLLLSPTSKLLHRLLLVPTTRRAITAAALHYQCRALAPKPNKHWQQIRYPAKEVPCTVGTMAPLTEYGLVLKR